MEFCLVTAGFRVKRNEEDGRGLGLGLIEPRYNLATKVMSNGVEVIVATDRNIRPVETEFLRLLSSTVTRPITLAPHTLTNHMSMVLASEKEDENDLFASLRVDDFVTRTYYTTYLYQSTLVQNGETVVSTKKATVTNVRAEEASSHDNAIRPTTTREITLTQSPSLQTEIFHTTYTYLNTIVDDDQPLVMTSRYTLSNTVTANYDYFNQLEPSEVYPTTNTYLKTLEFTKTLTDGTDSQIVSTKNVVTQVVVTDAYDRETVIRPMTTDVTKTYFVTYTYFSTYIDGDRTKIKSDVSVSSDVTIEKFYIKPKKTTTIGVGNTERMTSVTRTAPLSIFATKTYLTTFTYFTTLLQGPSGEKPETIVTTRTRVMQNVVTETLSHKHFNEDYLVRLENSLRNQGSGNIVTTATLKDGEQMEITVFKGGMVPSGFSHKNANNGEAVAEENEIHSTGNLELMKTKQTSTTASSMRTSQTTYNDITAEALIADENEVVSTTVRPSSTSTIKYTNHKINQTEAVSITPTKTATVVSTIKREDVIPEDQSVKKKPQKPANDNPVNFLNLTSLGINGINVLGPVFNAMAELINNNIKNKANDSLPIKKPPAVKKPGSSNVNPLLNFVSGLKQTIEPKHKSTTPRTPVYIPVGSFAEDHEVAESQSNVVVAQNWLDTQGKNLEKNRIDNGITILEGGIPISPGQIITTNSDVIIGRPGSSGPRPPNFAVKNNVPIDMKPPPPPLTLEIPIDDVIGQHSTIKNVKPIENKHRPKPKPHDSGALDLNPPPAPPILNVHRPITINHKPHEIIPYKPDHAETSIIPIPVHLMENYVNGDIRHDGVANVAEGQINIIGNPTSNGHVIIHNEQLQVNSNMEDRSTGHPLLVNIQPSQVANIVIPPGSSTALIINNENQHSLKGEVIDDPSPHPEPETVGFVGAEPVLRLENGDLTPPLQNVHHRPIIEQNRPFRQQIPNKVVHAGHHYHFGQNAVGDAGSKRVEHQNTRVPIYNQGHHYRDVITNAYGEHKNPVKVGSGIYVDVSPPGHLPPRPDFIQGHGSVVPMKPPNGLTDNFSNHQSGMVHDVPLNAQVQLGSASNKEQTVKEILINGNKYDKVKNKHQGQHKNQNLPKKPHEDIAENLYPPPPPPPPVKTSNRRPPWPYSPYHPPQSPTSFIVPPPQVSHRPNYKPPADQHGTGPMMIPVGAGAPDQIYPYPRPEDIVIVPHNIHAQQSNHFDLETGDVNDPVHTEDGEEIQESNSRPLLPGQLPAELERVNKTIDDNRVNIHYNHGIQYGIGRPYPVPVRPQVPNFYHNKTTDSVRINYGVQYNGDVYNEAEQIFGSKLNGNTIRIPQRPQVTQEASGSNIIRPQHRPSTGQDTVGGSPIRLPQRPSSGLEPSITNIRVPQRPIIQETPGGSIIRAPPRPQPGQEIPGSNTVRLPQRPPATQETSGSNKVRVEATIDSVPAHDRGNITWNHKHKLDETRPQRPVRPLQQSTKRPPQPFTTPGIQLENLWISHGAGQTTRRPVEVTTKDWNSEDKRKPVRVDNNGRIQVNTTSKDKSDSTEGQKQWNTQSQNEQKPKTRPRPTQNVTNADNTRVQSDLTNHKISNASNHQPAQDFGRNKTATQTIRHPGWVENVPGVEINKLSQGQEFNRVKPQHSAHDPNRVQQHGGHGQDANRIQASHEFNRVQNQGTHDPNRNKQHGGHDTTRVQSTHEFNRVQNQGAHDHNRVQQQGTHEFNRVHNQGSHDHNRVQQHSGHDSNRVQGTHEFNRVQQHGTHDLNRVQQHGGHDKNRVQQPITIDLNRVPQQGNKKHTGLGVQQTSASENIWTQHTGPGQHKPETDKTRIPIDIEVGIDSETNDWTGTKPTRVPIDKYAQPNVTSFPQPTWHQEDIYRNRTSVSKPPATAADINNLLTPPKATEVMGLSPPPPDRPRRPPLRQRPKPPFKFDLTTPRAPIAIENDFPPVRSPDFNKKPIKPQDIFPPKLPENFIHHVPEYPIRTPKPRPQPRPPVTSLPINVPDTQQTADTNEISQVFGSQLDINGHSKPVSGEEHAPVVPVKRPKPPQKKPETVILYDKPTEKPSRPVAITPTRSEASPPTGNVIWGSETVFEPEEFNKYKTPIIKDTTRKMVTTLITTGATTIFGDFYTPRPADRKPTATREPEIAPTHTTTLTVTTTMTTVIHSHGQKPSTKTIVLTKTILSTVVDKVTETQTLVRPTTATVTQTHTIATTKTALIVPTAIRPSPTKSHPGVTLKPEIFVADPHSKDTMTISVSTSMSKDKKAEEKRKHSGKRPDIDNDSILVVMTNKHPKANLSREHYDEDAESVDGTGVFLGGVYNADTTKRYKPPIWQMECVPECRATRNERCQKQDGAMKCICRPGFARMFPDRPCMPTYTYNMKLLLDKTMPESVEDLQQSESTSYIKLKALTKEGLDRMVMQSDLRDVFHGVSVNGFQPMQKKTMVDFYVQLSENTDESKLMDVFKKTLRHSNYSLGGTELYAAREADMLEAEDFNECLNPKFHDCSENARCFNLKGTYTCSCKEGFTDLSENTLFPGRMCSDMIGCEYCGYHGTCYTRDDNQITCECFQWYSGDRCRINLKVLLIALVTIGSILLALLLVCGVLTCLKRKSRSSTASRHNGSAGYLRYRGPPTQSLDKRAMIAADSSSESSVENLPYINPPPPPPPSGTLSAKRKPVLRQNMKGPAPRPKELAAVEQQDRSVTVMIPRAKYRPVPPMSPLLTMSTFSPDKHLHRTSAQISTEQKLINYLENNSRDGANGEQKTNQKTYDTPRSAPAFKKEQRVFEYEYKTSNMQINDGTSSGERRSSKHGDSDRRFRRHSDSTHLHSENSRNFQHRKYSAGALVSAGFEVSATVGLRHNDFDTSEDEHSGILNTSTMKSNRSQFTTLNRTGDHKTMSEARSYDETTIHPPTRTLKTNYSGSSPSSRVNNDEGHTMVERDLGSTFIMPESHLFKPERDRGSDISTFDSL